MTELLKKLTSATGVSGFENDVRCKIYDEIKDFADEIKIDLIGNLLCYKKGKKAPKDRILYAAHMDEVGLYINSVEESGLLRFDSIGILSNALLGKHVLIGDNKIRGIISAKPIHLLKGDEKDNYPKIEDLYIDIGVENKEDAIKLGVYANYAVFDTVYSEIGSTVKMKALDDRVGCTLLCELIKSELENDSFFAFTVGEEIGARGAAAAVNRIKPKICVIVEGTTASDILDVEGAERVCVLGNGAVCPFMDGGTYYDKELYLFLNALAKKENIKIQTKTMVAGGTDAQIIQRENAGIKTVAVSLACRYIHTGTTLANLNDIYEMKKILTGIDKNLFEVQND